MSQNCLELSTVELKQFDGKGPTGKLYVAVNGKIFDVTEKGSQFYGKGTCQQLRSPSGKACWRVLLYGNGYHITQRNILSFIRNLREVSNVHVIRWMFLALSPSTTAIIFRIVQTLFHWTVRCRRNV